MARAWVCRWCKGPPVAHPPLGPCDNCGGWYRHDVVNVREGDVFGADIPPLKDGEPITAADLFANLEGDESLKKRPTRMSGMDHVFAGGLPHFGAALLCAMAGTGKTTLLYELLCLLAKQKVRSMYITSEQSLPDLGRQFQRLGPPPEEHLILLAEQDRDRIIRAIEKERPLVVVLDSLHEVERVTDEDGYPMASGEPRAVTRVAKEIRRLSHDEQFFAFLVGHMNNDGTMAGGTHLRHAVDATLVLERIGGESDPRRILQFKGKTRFGPLGRKALFKMGESGMRDCGPYADDEDEPAPFPTGRGPRGLN